MNSDHENLREAFQALATADPPLDRECCPSVDIIATSFEPGASKRDKRRIVDHLSKCAWCREEFGLYSDLQAYHSRLLNDPELGMNGGPSRAPSWSVSTLTSSLWSYACLLIGFALVVGALLLVIRNADFSEVRRAATTAISLVYPRMTHNKADELVFRWKHYAPAERYVLELFDSSLLLVWSSPPIPETRIGLPTELVPQIDAGASFYWMVTAYAGSAKIGESELRRFVIRE